MLTRERRRAAPRADAKAAEQETELPRSHSMLSQLFQRGKFLAASPWVKAALVLVALFFVLAMIESGSRSFFIDEAATMSEGAARLRDKSYQSQHGWFLDAYYWWTRQGTSLTFLRFPSVMAMTLGVLLSGVALARRWGPRAGFLAVAMLLAVPLVWRSGVEMRFYGFLLMFGAMTLLAMLAAWRGWVVLGVLVSGAVGVVAYKFHPAAAPYHGYAMGICLLCAAYWSYRSARHLRDGDEEQRRKWHIGRILFTGAAYIGGLTAAVAVAPNLRVFAKALLNRRGNLASEQLANGWSAGDIFWHSFSWAGSEPWRFMGTVAPIALAILFATGAIVLFRRRERLLASALVLSVLVHYGSAFTLSWNTLFSIKYLMSSLPVLILVAAVGADWLIRRASSWTPIAGGVAAAAVFLAFLFPGYCDSMKLMYLRDPSHALQIGHIIESLNRRNAPPRVVGPSGFHECHSDHTLLGHVKPMVRIYRTPTTTDIERAFLARPVDFFKVEIVLQETEHIGYEPLPSPVFNHYGPFYSSSNDSFSYNLWHFSAEPSFSTGQRGKLVPGRTPYFTGAGSWTIRTSEGTVVTLGEKNYRDGETVDVAKAGALQWSVSPTNAAVELVPFFGPAGIVRAGGHAQSGTMDNWNAPHTDGEHFEYYMHNNYSPGYDFDFPAEPFDLLVEVKTDAPGEGGFMVDVGDTLVGIYGIPSQVEPGKVLTFRIRMPEEIRGTRGRLHITNIGENSARESDSETIRVLHLRRLSLVPRTGTGTEYSHNSLRDLKINPALSFTEDGAIPLDHPELLKHFQVNSRGEKATLSQEKGGVLSIRMPDVTSDQEISFGPFPVEPNSLIVPILEVLTSDITRTNIVPIVYYFDGSGTNVGNRQLSMMPIGRDRVDWTRRTNPVIAPPDATLAILMLYINSPPNYESEKDARYDIRKLRLIPNTFESLRN